MSKHRATVVITTHNRPDELSRALHSCQLQEGVDLQVLVFDDASEPPLAPTVARAFPNVQIVRNESRLGYIVLRNRGFQLASGEYVLSIDDDAYFSDPRTVLAAIEGFSKYPRAAAFALRYYEPCRTERDGFIDDLADGSVVRNFIGCSHVIRRDIAREMQGYRELFVHQVEELDLCLRLWSAGYEVRYLATPAIVHEPSPRRDYARRDFYAVRNTLLFDSLNIGWMQLGYRIAADSWLLLRHTARGRGWVTAVKWVTIGYGACIAHWKARAPVTYSAFKHFRRLPYAGPSRPPGTDQE